LQWSQIDALATLEETEAAQDRDQDKQVPKRGGTQPKP
jgi:hypothetical protein